MAFVVLPCAAVCWSGGSRKLLIFFRRDAQIITPQFPRVGCLSPWYVGRLNKQAGGEGSCSTRPYRQEG